MTAERGPLESDLRRAPTKRELVRHSIDGAGPILGFVVGNQVAGVRAGAITAVVVAVVVGLIRRYRGESRRVVVGSTILVGVLALSATATGEGRGFFLPELLFNIAGLVVFSASLLVGRPLTAVICSALRLEDPRCWTLPDRRRVHLRLTITWVAMWAVHVILIGTLYRMDSVVGLGVASTIVNKPTIVALVVITGIVVRRRPREREAA